MQNSFYNTINFSGKDLEEANAKVKKQEDLVLAIFKANPNLKFSPSQMHNIFGRKYNLYPPITSIRRSITNLAGRLELIKTDETVPGLYHLPEHTWKLANAIDIKNVTTSPYNGTCNTNNPTFIQSTIFDLSPVTASWDDTIDRQ